MQVVDAVAPSVEENIPSAHAPVHSALVKPALAPYVPTGHLVHEIAAAIENMPALQVPEHASE